MNLFPSAIKLGRKQTMKTRLILLTLIAGFLLFGAQTKPGLTTETEDVPRFTYVQHEASWYKDQMIAWKEVLDVQPKNASAWKNYFYAHRYYKLAGGQRYGACGAMSPYPRNRTAALLNSTGKN